MYTVSWSDFKDNWYSRCFTYCSTMSKVCPYKGQQGSVFMCPNNWQWPHFSRVIRISRFFNGQAQCLFECPGNSQVPHLVRLAFSSDLRRLSDSLLIFFGKMTVSESYCEVDGHSLCTISITWLIPWPITWPLFQDASKQGAAIDP
jgi:hypothetical protein